MRLRSRREDSTPWSSKSRINPGPTGGASQSPRSYTWPGLVGVAVTLAAPKLTPETVQDNVVVAL